MNPEFWHHRWQSNDIAFHGSDANPLLVQHFPALLVHRGGRVFVPLCGKTRDIHWLRDKGYRVVAAELSELAIRELFRELEIEPQISESGQSTHYSAPGIDVFVGDIFALTHETIGPVDAIYDRAALVALPDGVRGRYAEHLVSITKNAPQLVIGYEYDQSVMEGPPFSVGADEVRNHYAANYVISFLGNQEVAGGLKGMCPASESVWLLKQRTPTPH